jgi:hypothetical protein
VNLEAINASAQLLAAIGVIVSLFYLAAQIRQNTRSTRAVVVDSLAHSLVDLLGQHAENPELLRSFAAVTEDWNSATENDRVRSVPFIFATFKLFENAWFQQRQGTLDREQWEGWDVYMRIYYHRPGVKTWWSARRMAFAAGFRTYIEATQPVGEMMSIGEIIRGNRPASFERSPARGDRLLDLETREPIL